MACKDQESYQAVRRVRCNLGPRLTGSRTQSLLEQLKAAFNSCEEECGEAMLSIASGVAKGVKEFAAEMERIAKSASTTGCDGN